MSFSGEISQVLVAELVYCSVYVERSTWSSERSALRFIAALE
jgi:hypothetical protein